MRLAKALSGMYEMRLSANVRAWRFAWCLREPTGTSVRLLSSNQRWRSCWRPSKLSPGTVVMWFASRRLKNRVTKKRHGLNHCDIGLWHCYTVNALQTAKKTATSYPITTFSKGSICNILHVLITLPTACGLFLFKVTGTIFPGDPNNVIFMHPPVLLPPLQCK